MADLYSEYESLLPKKILDGIKDECKEKKLTSVQIKKVLEKVKNSYEDAIINPGEAIGIITAESIGEPGTQMSILNSEKILVKSNDNIKIIEIGKFIDS